MATNGATASAVSSPPNTPTIPANLSNLIPCQYTFVATRTKQDRTNVDNISDELRRGIVPRVCRLRARDNTMAIYALVDPIDTNMIASDVSVNMLVEQLSEISFDDDSYKEKIDAKMQKIFFEIENRLLQMTFDHAEEKVISAPSSVSAAEKLLPALEEAESGSFLFAAIVTQSSVYIAYVGTIRAFLISNFAGELSVSDKRPQYYHTGSLHTIENEDESRRLQNLDVDLNQVRNEGLDKKQSKFTRCIGKLSEKLLSSAASANDVNEARCNPLVCEPKLNKFSISPQDYALVLMTDKVYQMFLKSGVPEHEIPTKFLELLRDSTSSSNSAQYILDTIEDRFQSVNSSSNDDIDLQDMGLLIHFFHNPMNVKLPPPLAIKPSPIRRTVDGEVTVDEVKRFIIKNNEIQQKRDSKNRTSSMNNPHQRENQLHTSTIEPFVRFDVYEKLLTDNEELRQADKFITQLLYNEPTSVIDKKLADYLKEHSSLNSE